MSFEYPKNIVLIGMRGSGKSTLGRRLAEICGRDFIDTDELIVAREGRTIADIIADSGWDYFRDIEAHYVAEAAAYVPAVIATGGGVILRADNVAHLKKTGVLILLDVPLETLRRRIARSDRPSLGGTKSAADELADVWRIREPLYRTAADIVIADDTDSATRETITQKCKRIIAAVSHFA